MCISQPHVCIPGIQRGTQSSSHSADLIHSANTHRLYIQGPHHCSYVSLNFPERQTVPSKSLSKTKAWPCFWSLQPDTSLHCLQTFPQPGKSVSTKFRLREREKKNTSLAVVFTCCANGRQDRCLRKEEGIVTFKPRHHKHHFYSMSSLQPLSKAVIFQKRKGVLS